LEDYWSIFAENEDDLGRTSIVQHHINTSDAVPIRQRPRRVPFAKEAEISRQLEEMLKPGIIEPSSSPWASPVTLAPKSDGSWRFCNDYQRLNDVTVKDSYPLPRMDDLFDILRGTEWFSIIDMKSGFWQVEMHLDDKEKTALCTTGGLWQYNVMPFGLCNAPATFERLMENVLRDIIGKIGLVYMDDVIVFSKTSAEHIEHLRIVF